VFVISGCGVCDIRERCFSHQGAVFVISGNGVTDIRDGVYDISVRCL